MRHLLREDGEKYCNKVSVYIFVSNMILFMVPVKFIVGDLDITYTLPGAKEYINGGLKKEMLNLEEVVAMKGVAHFLNQEKPEQISPHIVDFIRKF
ncbi:hypothetical protein LOK49_LG15G00193 [Camellia lanceoleosa]|uniref:Uncharacterized protein n=1 Tax=Camellia lanceoleosa TaxID=1840588 RepID=A0ACC0F792_9ERIC|nr:hypothetical protein LOK49_LG15G00193 [Camellia lanceoleosa]